jgi:hypothetical protein
MVMSKPVWLGLIVVLTLLGVLLARHPFVRETPHRVDATELAVEDRLPEAPNGGGNQHVEPDAGQADQAQTAASFSGLHRRLVAMPAPERNHIFHMILQDAGADCIEVLSSEHVADETSTWHAHCGATRTYSVVLDDFGSRVYPIPYGDFNSQVPTTIEPQ